MKIDELTAKRHLILLAEIGALIHDLGKLSKEFIIDINDEKRTDVHQEVLSLHCRCPEPPNVAKFRSCNEDWGQFVAGEIQLWLDNISTGDSASDRKIIQGGEDYLQGVTADKALERAKNFIGSLGSGKVLPSGQQLKKAYLGLLQMDDRIDALTNSVEQTIREVVDHQKRLEREKLVTECFLPAPIGLEKDGLPDLLYGLELCLGNEKARMSDYVEMHHQAHWAIPHLVKLLRADDMGADYFDSWLDKQTVTAKQDISHTLISTAFGHEPESQRVKIDELADIRHLYAHALAGVLQRIKDAGGELPADKWRKLLCDPRTGLRARTRAAFLQALGETRRPANDVTLWDHCYSVASLYKAALAKVLIEEKWTAPKDIHWRILRVSFDGFGFWAQAHHVTDMLGRREAIADALDRVREALEITCPLGNEIYRDENGSAFLMPDLGDRHTELEETVCDLVKNAVDRTVHEDKPVTTDLSGELVPACRWHCEPVRDDKEGKDDKDVKGAQEKNMAYAFGATVQKAPPPLARDLGQMDAWWRPPQSEGKEICTVCGVRPVGYRPEGVKLDGWVRSDKAEKRHVCCVCLHRRGRRAQEWLTQGDNRTIWADEVADENGRFALIVGRFDLSRWLDGTLVRTLLVKEGESKNPSPARIRRVWETCRRFWETVQAQEIPSLLEPLRPRLIIEPEFADTGSKKELGDCHAYVLRVDGFDVGVVWDPGSKSLILTEYTDDVARRLGLLEEAQRENIDTAEVLRRRLEGRSAQILEPSGYSSPSQEIVVGVRLESVTRDDKPYLPLIPLVTEPALFMAFVPAGKAMDVAQAIKEKYECEMSKVRDRLPLHLGVVIAPRRTPLRAVLEAGRAMLNRGEEQGARGWEEWRVVEKPQLKQANEAPDYLTQGNQHFEEWWDVSLENNGRRVHLRIGAKMGDGNTKDEWYTNLLTRQPKPTEEDFADKPWKCPQELDVEDEVWLAPSTFDFEFLDTTARRFDVAYDEQGRRLGRATRPYLLGEIGDLQRVWDIVSGRLSTSQWMALDGLIEQKRREWREPWGISDDYSTAFEQLVHDALRNADWKWKVNEEEKKGWKMLNGQEQGLLKRAALQGILNDVINLYHEAMKQKGEK